MILRVKGQNFIVKVNGFQFDRVLHVHPNTHQGVKYFPNFIYTQNKNSQRFHLGVYEEMEWNVFK